jgi:hypothetical protein
MRRWQRLTFWPENERGNQRKKEFRVPLSASRAYPKDLKTSP